MRYRITAASGADVLVAAASPASPLRRMTELLPAGQLRIEPAAFIEGEELLQPDSRARLLSASDAADPGMQAYQATDAILSGTRFVVLVRKQAVWNRVEGDHARAPEPDIDANFALDARKQLFLDVRDQDVDYYPGRYVMAYWDAAEMYHHWVFESLARAALCETSEALRGLTLLLPANAPKFVAQTLQLLGIGPDRLAYFDPKRVCVVEELVVIPVPVYGLTTCSGAALRHLRERVLSAPHDAQVGPAKRIVLTRRDAPAGERLLINEAEVVAALEQRGFTPIEASTLSFGQQVRLVNQAEMIACVHGSSGANLLFCAPGAKVLHLFPDCVHYFHTHGIGTSIAGAEYAYVFGPSFERKLRYHNNPWLLGPQRVLRAVDRFGG